MLFGNCVSALVSETLSPACATDISVNARTIDFIKAAISGNGQYRTISGRINSTPYLAVSSDYGNSYNLTDINIEGKISMSFDGKYQLINGYLSADFGSSWELVFDNEGYIDTDMSFDGKYQYIAVSNYGLNYAILYRSSNYGIPGSWIQSSLVLNNVSMKIQCSYDGSGVYVLSYPRGGPSTIYKSTDFATTFTELSSFNKILNNLGVNKQ